MSTDTLTDTPPENRTRPDLVSRVLLVLLILLAVVVGIGVLHAVFTPPALPSPSPSVSVPTVSPERIDDFTTWITLPSGLRVEGVCGAGGAQYLDGARKLTCRDALSRPVGTAGSAECYRFDVADVRCGKGVPPSSNPWREGVKP